MLRSQTQQTVELVLLVLWGDGLPIKHTHLFHTKRKKGARGSAFLLSPTSCRDSVIGSFSSVSSNSNTGLDDVDGSFSSFWLSYQEMLGDRKHSKWFKCYKWMGWEVLAISYHVIDDASCHTQSPFIPADLQINSQQIEDTCLHDFHYKFHCLTEFHQQPLITVEQPQQ